MRLHETDDDDDDERLLLVAAEEEDDGCQNDDDDDDDDTTTITAAAAAPKKARAATRGGSRPGGLNNDMPLCCALCFRELSRQRWTTCKPGLLRALMRMDAPPYASIVMEFLDRMQEQQQLQGAYEREALLCDYCASFLKERAHSSSALRYEPAPHEEARRLRKGRKHGMQMAVEHVLSGGSMPAPSRPHLWRCLKLLAEKAHPFQRVRDGDLGDRLTALRVQRVIVATTADADDLTPAVAAVSPGEGDDTTTTDNTNNNNTNHNNNNGGGVGDDDPLHLSVIRWLFEGRSRVFGDAAFARNMRRWMSARGNAPQHPPVTTVQQSLLSRGANQKKKRRRAQHHHNNDHNKKRRRGWRNEDEEEEDVSRSSSSSSSVSSSSRGRGVIICSEKKEEEEGIETCHEWAMPEPCRFCQSYRTASGNNETEARRLRSVRTPASPIVPSSYAGILASGADAQSLQASVEALETETEAGSVEAMAGLLLFCLQCHRVAAISYEYDCALRQRLGLRAALSADAYYARLVRLGQIRRRTG